MATRIENKSFGGGIYLLISALIYGLYGVYSRFIGASFGSFSQSWVRSFIVLMIVVVLLLVKKFEWKRIERKDIKWFLIWIIPTSIQPVITFTAFNHLPLATTYFLIYSTMIFGGVLSGKIFFSEKFNFAKGLSFLFIFVGLVLIYGSDISLATNIYVVLALISGLLVGFWNTLTKKVSTQYSEFQMMSLDQFATMIVCGIGAFFFRETLPPPSNINAWFWIIVFAVSGVVTVFFLIRGFKYVEAQVGSLILPMEIVFASIFGLLIFGEVLKLNTYLGGLFIVFAAILPAIGNKILGERK
ncbi:MAG: DMT family transporter [Candidatus Woesebacteria bacterium]|nr:MAG: DMT family transporter [Candidatus Woesebacteria bacterium]